MVSTANTGNVLADRDYVFLKLPSDPFETFTTANGDKLILEIIGFGTVSGGGGIGTTPGTINQFLVEEGKTATAQLLGRFINPPGDLPDIAVTSVTTSDDQQSVNVDYTIIGQNLPSASTIGFYWATGPNFADRLEKTPVAQAETDTKSSPDTYSISKPISDLGTQPPDAKYILAVADSPDLANGNPNGLILESNENNNAGSVQAPPQMVNKAMPKVSVSDKGGMAHGMPFPATATVAGVIAGVDDKPAASLEGVSPTLTYYAGSTASGTPLPGPPSAAGTYTVVATFPGSADYAIASTMSTFVINSCTPGEQFNVDLAAGKIAAATIPPKFTDDIEFDLEKFTATFTEQAPTDQGAICSATGDTSTDGGVATPGRYMYVRIPLLGPGQVVAYATTRVTVTLFPTAPSSVSLGDPPPADSMRGTFFTGAHNVWLNQHNPSDKVLEWYTPGFTTFLPHQSGPASQVGQTGPLEDWVDIPNAMGSDFTTIVQQAEQMIESTNQEIVFKKEVLPFLAALVFFDPGKTSLLITDPMGNETGRTADGSVIQNIPGSVYFPSLPLALIVAPSSGLYKTTVQGVAPGAYQLVTALVNGGQVIAQQTFSGQITAGQSVYFSTSTNPQAGLLSTTIIPNALPPTVLAGSNGNATTWEAFTRTASFQDISGIAPFKAAVDYGDGSSVQPLALNSDKTFQLSHVYASPGNFTVTVSVSDAAGLTGSGKFTVTVTQPSSGLGPVPDAFVTTLYREVLGRFPELSGLRFWASVFVAHVRPTTIVRAFVLSPERRSLVNQGVAPRITPLQALLDADRAAHQIRRS